MDGVTGPFVLIVGPLVAGLIVSLLRRWPRIMNGVAAAMAFSLWWFLRAQPLAEGSRSSWYILGRELILTPLQLEAFSLALAGLVILLLLSQVAPAGPVFAPLALATFAPLAAAAMITPTLFQPPALLAAFALVAGLIQAGQAGSTQGSLRFLALMVFTIPLLLMFNWFLDSGQFSEGLASSRISLLVILIMLAGFPFHIWVTPTVIQSTPITAVYIFSLFQMLLVIALPEAMTFGLAAQLDPQLLTFLAWSGAITALIGGLLAWQAVTFSQLWAYILLIDLGATLIVLASGDGNILLLLSIRFVTLSLAAVGLSSLRKVWPEEQPKGVKRVPGQGVIGLVLFSYSLIALIGLPLSIGFVARWQTLQQSWEQSNWLALVLVIGCSGAMVGVARFLAPIWATIWQQRNLDGAVETNETLTMWVQGGLIIFGVILALFPQWLTRPLSALLDLL